MKGSTSADTRMGAFGIAVNQAEMKTVKSSVVMDLAEQCLDQGLIDRYEIGQGVKLQICGNSVHLRSKQARTVLETLLKELGEGSPNWMPLK